MFCFGVIGVSSSFRLPHLFFDGVVPRFCFLPGSVVIAVVDAFVVRITVVAVVAIAVVFGILVV